MLGRQQEQASPLVSRGDGYCIYLTLGRVYGAGVLDLEGALELPAGEGAT